MNCGLNSTQPYFKLWSFRAAVSNLVAIRHMWRQAQFPEFHIFGNFKDPKTYVQLKV